MIKNVTRSIVLASLGLSVLRRRCANFVSLGLDAEPVPSSAKYSVRLHFAEIEDIAPDARVFDIALQGETVLTALDIAREAGVRKALVKEFHNVVAADTLVIEFIPSEANMQPILSALEIRAE